MTRLSFRNVHGIRFRMKRAVRWAIYIFLVLGLVVIVGILSLDTIARSIAEKRISKETGMEAHIGKLEIGFRTQSVHIENFKLINPPEFGGSTFVDFPELHVEYDLDAIRDNRLHLKLVRFNIAHVHVVQTKDGKKNTDIFQKKEEKPAVAVSTNKPTAKSSEPMKFAGIDRLEISIGEAKFTSDLHPNQNYTRDLRVQNRVFNDIKTEKDLQNVGVILVAQAGFSALLEGVLTNPGEVIKKGSSAGKETRKLLESVVAPFKKKK